MNRAQALAIFNTMGDDKLFEALEAVGVPSGDTGGGGDFGVDMGLEPWNARQVQLGEGHGGMFLDRSRFQTQMPQSQQRQNPEPDYKKFSPSGYEDFAAYDPSSGGM
jgi:hypothetical protein